VSYYAAIDEATRGPIASDAFAGCGGDNSGLGGNDTIRGTHGRFIGRFVCARLAPAQMLR